MSTENKKMIAVYWLPEVTIGPATPPPDVLPGEQKVRVPLIDIINCKNADGSQQIDVVNLWGTTFTKSQVFQYPFLIIDSILQDVLTNKTYKQLQNAGIKVVLTIVGADKGKFGWSSIPEDQIEKFVDYLNQTFLNKETGYGLDGIDIDDEYAGEGNTLAKTVKTMRKTFAPEKIISKALFSDHDVIPDIKNYLTYGGIMTYGDRADTIQGEYNQYITDGLKDHQLLIGVNAGPVKQPGTSFTSIETTKALTKWQPGTGRTKLGMMVWTFSQDIQQFTAYPQNQAALKFPNRKDHEWLATIVNE